MPESDAAYPVPSRVLDGDFAGWLRDAMASRRISSRMLAMRTGIDHTAIYRLAAGDHQPMLATALALLRVLTPEPTGSQLGADEQVDEAS